MRNDRKWGEFPIFIRQYRQSLSRPQIPREQSCCVRKNVLLCVCVCIRAHAYESKQSSKWTADRNKRKNEDEALASIQMNRINCNYKCCGNTLLLSMVSYKSVKIENLLQLRNYEIYFLVTNTFVSDCSGENSFDSVQTPHNKNTLIYQLWTHMGCVCALLDCMLSSLALQHFFLSMLICR